MTDQSKISELIDHLFRHESGKIVSVLTRIFGPHNLELAEDVVQDSLLEAMKVWAYKGVPQNPAAWLQAVAKNKVLNIINHRKYKNEYTTEITRLLESDWTVQPALDYLFSEDEILDDQLRMMFTCCHPAISADSQIALILKTLCGFSIPEISRAFLTKDDTINKRLVRARKQLREANEAFEVPHGKELEKRLDTVLEALYLLFNEGYNASVGEHIIRYGLCAESIRLTELMGSHKALEKYKKIDALLALMYLNASRFKGRQDDEGNIILMEDQDRTHWDQDLMKKGYYHLKESMSAHQLSVYHILAAISAHHCSAPDYTLTDWQGILGLYDDLLHFDRSPVVQLNRAVALSRAKGTKPKAGIKTDLLPKPKKSSPGIF